MEEYTEPFFKYIRAEIVTLLPDTCGHLHEDGGNLTLLLYRMEGECYIVEKGLCNRCAVKRRLRLDNTSVKCKCCGKEALAKQMVEIDSNSYHCPHHKESM